MNFDSPLKIFIYSFKDYLCKFKNLLFLSVFLNIFSILSIIFTLIYCLLIAIGFRNYGDHLLPNFLTIGYLINLVIIFYLGFSLGTGRDILLINILASDETKLNFRQLFEIFKNAITRPFKNIGYYKQCLKTGISMNFLLPLIMKESFSQDKTSYYARLIDIFFLSYQPWFYLEKININASKIVSQFTFEKKKQITKFVDSYIVLSFVIKIAEFILFIIFFYLMGIVINYFFLQNILLHKLNTLSLLAVIFMILSSFYIYLFVMEIFVTNYLLVYEYNIYRFFVKKQIEDFYL
jgi:hypothetical protein